MALSLTYHINHWILFTKIIKQSIPSVIVGIILFWHCIKWGQHTSSFFTISNGTRQGPVLSPRLFSMYADDLSHLLADSKVGCFIDNSCMNHFIYADDICVFAPSPSSLQKLLNICDNFRRVNCTVSGLPQIMF